MGTQISIRFHLFHSSIIQLNIQFIFLSILPYPHNLALTYIHCQLPPIAYISKLFHKLIQKQMSTKNKCQQNPNVNQKQMSTKTKCQPKTNVNSIQINSNQFNLIQFNGCHVEVTQPCLYLF